MSFHLNIEMLEREKERAGKLDLQTQTDRIDLSKISLMEVGDFWRRMRAGTPTGTFIKISMSVVGGIVAVASIGGGIDHFVGEYYAKPKNSTSVDRPVVIEAPQGKADTSAPDVSRYVDEIKSKEQTIVDMTSRIANLQDQLSKKPDYSRCLAYDNDLSGLRKKKDVVENNIQILLNPPLTREQTLQGIGYSVDQLEVFVKQAAEYRKEADDLQKEILSVESSRSACTE